MQQPAIDLVEAEAVDLEPLERAPAALAAVDRRSPVDLDEVAHAAQQPVGDPRRAAGAAGDLVGALGVEPDVRGCPPSARRSRASSAGAVVLEVVHDAEAVAQRRREQPEAGRRADQRERRQLEPHGPRAGPLPITRSSDAVLHRRVEDLLERPARGGGSRR